MVSHKEFIENRKIAEEERIQKTYYQHRETQPEVLPKQVDKVQPDYNVTIFTDGASEPNPGPSGFAAIILFKDKQVPGGQIELSGGFRMSTNSRMEIMGAIAGLEFLKEPSTVLIRSDSEYLVKSASKWIHSWRHNEWKKSNGKPALNTDLFKRLLPLLDKHTVVFEWVKSHCGIPMNELADKLANEAICCENPEIDYVFEADKKSK